MDIMSEWELFGEFVQWRAGDEQGQESPLSFFGWSRWLWADSRLFGDKKRQFKLCLSWLTDSDNGVSTTL